MFSSDDGSSSASSSDSSDGSFRARSRKTSAATPDSSVPPTPEGSMGEAARLAVHRPGKTGAVSPGRFLAPAPTPQPDAVTPQQVNEALLGLRRRLHDERWSRAYDVLLVALAGRGEALAEAQKVGTALRRQAAERVRLLAQAAQAGALAGHENEALATAALLRRLKHDHASKQRLNTASVALEAARAQLDAQNLRHAGAARPAVGGRAAALAPVVPVPTAASAAPPTLLRPLRVRKQLLPLPDGKVEALACGPVSTLAVGGPGSTAGPVLAVVGATLARGSSAKVRPAVLLAAGRALVGDNPGPWVLRRVYADARVVDPEKAHLRGTRFRTSEPVSGEMRREEAEALAAARSPLQPALHLHDGHGKHYELVRRYHGNAAQLVDVLPPAARGAALGRMVLEGVLPALEALHADGRAHFDIKPENLFVDAERAQVVLGDYGLSRRLTPRSATLRGTYGYQAPEMWTQAGRSLTPAVDLYGLAVAVAGLLAPHALAASPLRLPDERRIEALRPDLAARAPEALRDLGLPLTPASRRLGTVALQRRELAGAYRAWYAVRGPQLAPDYRGPKASWASRSFDLLFGQLQALDPTLAHLVARGLHPDLEVRGNAAEWSATLAAAAAVTATERLQLTDSLRAANAGHALSGVQHDAYASLERVAATLEA